MKSTSSREAVDLVETLGLNEAIRATRAFALYFQLINIVEQHYEQRGEQQQYRAAYERVTGNGDRPTQSFFTRDSVPSYVDPDSHEANDEVNLLTRGFQETSQYRREARTFQGMFPKLHRLNVPPQHIQRLIDTLRCSSGLHCPPNRNCPSYHPGKATSYFQSIASVRPHRRRLRHAGDASQSWEAEDLRNQLTEEIRLWWRTDELHQFKPTVLDEVDFTLHYFEEVLFDAIPQLYQRFCGALNATFPALKPPRYDFCKFGSWVGSDRDGNPSVTPQITWKTACYQRNLVIGKYIQSIDKLIDLLSLSLHWSDVLPNLLESLEQDQVRMPEVYEKLAIRYRQEPYRLKLSYIKQRLNQYPQS